MAYGSEHGQEPDHDHTPKANESASVAPEDRAHCWTLDGVVINQVQYKYLGIWFQEDGGWDHHADKALNKMRSAYGYWRPLLACARLPTRVRLLMLQTFVYSAVTYGAEVWDCTQLMRERMSVVVKKGVRAILGLHPWTAHVMRCTGHRTNAGALIDAAKICWHDVSTPPRALDQVCSGLQLHWAEVRAPGWADWTQSLQKAVHGYRSR
jgi:hypothetical protein